MNYFELYELPVSFNPDQAVVKRQFYALSKKYHPDFYINDTPEKQEEVLELATLNNKAYKVLTHPFLRLQYVLQLNNMLTEGENYVLPQHFLLEMMELNEEIMELEFEPNPEALLKLTANVKAVEAELTKELDSLTSGYETADEATKGDYLARIKDLYYRNKYLVRLHESVSKLKENAS